MKNALALVALSLAVAACGDSGSNDTDAGTNTDAGTVTIEPKLSVISQKIFVQKACTACHSASAPAVYGSLALTPEKAYEQLVGKDVEGSSWPSKYTKRVVAGDPSASALTASVEHRSDIPEALHMPSPSSPSTKLSAAEITAINTWIQEGAQNN